jgi:ubiquitin carboxyl-terminal hydrolase 7
MDISLNITNSLKESLDLFISTELLEGENSYNHDELGKQEAVKYHLFKKLPPILLINLKRYRYEDGGF